MDDRLAAALEDCRGRIGRGESMQQCLERYPALAEQLRPLLPLMAELRALGGSPDSAYAQAARRRFHEQVQQAQARSRQAAPGGLGLRWLRRLALPLAAVAVLAASGTGLVQASADALPGTPLFPVQQAHERVVEQLAARSHAQSALYHFNLANKRLNQVHRAEALHAGPKVIEELTAGMVRNTTLATQDVAGLNAAQRQQAIAKLAPLLAQEDRLLMQLEQNPAPLVAKNAPAQRRQVRGAAERLRLPVAPVAATPVPSPAAQTPATPALGALEAAQSPPPARSDVAGRSHGVRDVGVWAAQAPPSAPLALARAARPDATPRPIRTPLPLTARRPSTVSIVTPLPERRLVQQFFRHRRRPVHTPTL